MSSLLRNRIPTATILSYMSEIDNMLLKRKGLFSKTTAVFPQVLFNMSLLTPFFLSVSEKGHVVTIASNNTIIGLSH